MQVRRRFASWKARANELESAGSWSASRINTRDTQDTQEETFSTATAENNGRTRYEAFYRLRQHQGDRNAGRHRHHRRRHDQPDTARQGAGRLPREPEEDLRDREGAGQRRGDGD